MTLVADLGRAIGAGELALHYQPQVDFRTGRLVGAEALLRWHHPTRGLIPPLEFVPMAEESGLIGQLTPWVIERALEQQRSWRTAGLKMRMSVNVSMRNLGDPEFLGTVEARIARAPIERGSLTFEVTEGVMMLEERRTLDVLLQLRALGVNLSIDNLGTGYSSLSYLSRLPVNEVKIDRSFVMDLPAPGARAVLRAAIAMGRAFRVSIVAEGVKDGSTWLELHSLGCDVAQGYYVSEPLPAEAFVAWARRRPGH
jgi:EAL domain-containing protein (putative c-di-GMP-specific phosphodiesterase class I)